MQSSKYTDASEKHASSLHVHAVMKSDTQPVVQEETSFSSGLWYFTVFARFFQGVSFSSAHPNNGQVD